MAEIKITGRPKTMFRNKEGKWSVTIITENKINGDVFDQNDDVRFTLNRVVKGWQEGLQLIGEGGHAELAIPSDLGYGEYGSRGIEPNSVLLFDVTLNKVGKFVEKAEEPAKKK